MKIALYILLTIASIGISYIAWAYKKLDKGQKGLVEFANSFNQQRDDSSIQMLLAEYPTNTQIAVAIFNGQYTVYYGFLKKETGIEPMLNSKIFFEIGSVTKTFTAALAAHCFQKDLLKPSTTLKEVFSFSMPEEIANITLLQLSNHTSGLPRLPKNMKMENPTNPYKDYDSTQLFAYLKKAKLDNAAGTKYSYSNLGMALLGEICSEKLEFSYADALKKYLFTPLQMDQSFVYPWDDAQQVNMILGRDPDGEIANGWDWDCMAGAGAVKSNLIEMVLYCKSKS